MNGFYLSITTMFLLFPIIIFIQNDKKNIYETILACLLVINIILSFLFWTNPIENNLIHFYDGICGKISYIVFSIYILFLKNLEYKIKLIYLILIFLSSLMFYFSSKFKKKWCSKNHLLCHSIFHFLISLGSSIAFI